MRHSSPGASHPRWRRPLVVGGPRPAKRALPAARSPPAIPPRARAVSAHPLCRRAPGGIRPRGERGRAAACQPDLREPVSHADHLLGPGNGGDFGRPHELRRRERRVRLVELAETEQCDPQLDRRTMAGGTGKRRLRQLLARDRSCCVETERLGVQKGLFRPQDAGPGPMANLLCHAQTLGDCREGRAPFAELLERLGAPVVTRQIRVDVPNVAGDLDALGGRLRSRPKIRNERAGERRARRGSGSRARDRRGAAAASADFPPAHVIDPRSHDRATASLRRRPWNSAHSSGSSTRSAERHALGVGQRRGCPRIDQFAPPHRGTAPQLPAFDLPSIALPTPPRVECLHVFQARLPAPRCLGRVDQSRTGYTTVGIGHA